MARHKIDGKGFVSKGLRRSCASIRKEHAKEVNVGGTMLTNLRTAFENARVTVAVGKREAVTGAAIINTVARSIKAKAGEMRLGKGWNAHLSFKTAKLLEMPECSNPLAMFKGRPSMAYDRMVSGE